MIRIAGSVSKGWMARKLGVAFDGRYYFDPVWRHAIDVRCNEYLRQNLGDLGLFYTESNLGRIEYYEPNQALVGGIQPNLIVGMLLGADLIPTADADADISGGCLTATDLASLPVPEALVTHPLIEQFDAQIRSLRENAAGDLRPIPPFFWDTSGRAAVHGAMTSGLKFLGDRFFTDMVTAPEPCQRLIEWLTDVSVLLIAHFAALADMHVTCIHVGECAACMVDVHHFNRFVVPATARLGAAVAPVRFHSCGRSDHLIESCAAITRLESLDVGGETSVARIRDVFGRQFPVGIAPLVEDLSASSPRGLLAWLERVVRENDGGDLTIGYHLEAGYPLDNLRALHDAVRRAAG